VTLGLVSGVTASRPRIFDLVIGSGNVTPADNSAIYYVARYTAWTVGGGVTPNPVDPGDVAAVSITASAPTTEPTYGGPPPTTILLSIPLNQRSSFRYVCSQGYEFVSPTGNGTGTTNGIGLRLSSATVAMVESAQIFFTE
jgi:hypothetical protein